MTTRTLSRLLPLVPLLALLHADLAQAEDLRVISPSEMKELKSEAALQLKDARTVHRSGAKQLAYSSAEI